MGILSQLTAWITKDRDPLDPLPADLQEALKGEPKEDVWTIEFYNDDVTPMLFVVKVFENYLNLSRKESVDAMLKIHQDGSTKLRRVSKRTGKRVVEQIQREAEKRNFPFKCALIDV